MLTLEEYEKLNPRCELTHEGKRVLFAAPAVFTQDPPELKRQATAAAQPAAPPVSNFTF